MRFLFKAGAVGACVFVLCKPIHAIDFGSHLGCSASSADFKLTKLTGAPGPLKMAFSARENNAVDVYFIQKTGEFRKYDAVTQQVVDLGKIPVAMNNEDGLVGLALDPAFKNNQRVFFMYSFLGGNESSFRISRFNLMGGKLDLASEKILIKIKSNRGKWHTAGAMQFDAYGDLWGAVGDNEQIESGPANTADLKGGIYRIHPDDSPQGYSIPNGNFGEHLAAQFRKAGNEALAKEYENPSVVLPEIYVKGTRNAYTLTLDPVRRWLTWGDVGPDQGKVSEEYNMVKEPFYMGWPYFAGKQDMAGVSPYGTPIPSGMSRQGPLNGPNVPGVKQLPAIREPIFARTQACAMTGPILRYDGENTSPFQFPPQLNRSWIISGCDNGFGFHLMTLDEAGETVVKNEKIFDFASSNALVDLKQGPDGALYFITYAAPGEAIYGDAKPTGGSINRIEYTGNCKDPAMQLEKPMSSSTRFYFPDQTLDPHAIYNLSRSALTISATEPFTFEVLDTHGKIWLRGEGDRQRQDNRNTPQKFSLAEIPLHQIYILRYHSTHHAFSQAFYPAEGQ